MSPKKVTLKDIATRCGVTPTIVSAVLNGRNDRITCSPAKRQQIQQVAKELDYQANFFARSIRMRQVPIIGLMLHVDKSGTFSKYDSYVNCCLHDMTFAFNRHDLEVLFIPYSTEEEQLGRLQKLVASGLLGGVVSNIIPDSHQKICSYLASSQLPYMILGAPKVDHVYCAYPTNGAETQFLQRLASERNLNNIYHVLHDTGVIKFVRYPFPGNYLWHGEQVPFEVIAAERDSALFVADIPGMNFLKTLNFEPAHLILRESDRYATLLPSDIEAMIFPIDGQLGCIAEYVNTTLVDWLFHDRKPEVYQKEFSIQESEWKYITKK